VASWSKLGFERLVEKESEITFIPNFVVEITGITYWYKIQIHGRLLSCIKDMDLEI